MGENWAALMGYGKVVHLAYQSAEYWEQQMVAQSAHRWETDLAGARESPSVAWTERRKADVTVALKVRQLVASLVRSSVVPSVLPSVAVLAGTKVEKKVGRSEKLAVA
jgi:hypothetical protein